MSLSLSGRERRVVLLLGSLHDFLPGPAGGLRTSSGLVPAAKRPCGDCGSSEHPGWVLDQFRRRVPCTTCGGASERHLTGWRDSDRGRGWVYVDPMDAEGRAVRTAEVEAPSTRPPRVVGCDACGGSGVGKPHLDESGREYREACVRCAGAGKRVVAAETLEDDPAERVGEPVGAVVAGLARRDRVGDYAALEHALEWLPLLHRRLVHRVYVSRELDVERLLDREREELAWALGELCRAMPSRIRVPSGVAVAERNRQEQLRRVRGVRNKSKVERDKEIRRLVRHGRPSQWVAREFGLSVSQVNRIVAGERQEEAA